MLRNHRQILQSRQKVGTEKLQRLQLILDYIHQHYQTSLSLGELSSRIPMSRENCCRFFRQMTGCTISQYLNDYRIFRSIHLMKTTAYSLSSIASLTGFSNASRFAAAFRKKTGCSPYLNTEKGIHSIQILSKKRLILTKLNRKKFFFQKTGPPVLSRSGSPVHF